MASSSLGPVIVPFDIEEIFPDSERPSDPIVRRPRRQEGSPQELAIELVADYTLLHRTWLPSAALVQLLHEWGVSDAAARTVISRLSRRGMVEGRRDGRRTLYCIPAGVANHLIEGGRWIASFAAATEPWDGLWTLVAYSLPKEQTLLRRRLRGQLRWHGFAPLYDGLWVSARPTHPGTEQQLRIATQGAITVFRAREVDLDLPTTRRPLDAWELTSVAEHYAAFLEEWGPVADQVGHGEIEGGLAVRTRTEVMDTYRRFPLLDPRLPDELLPADWPRRRAREVFVQIYDGLAAPAEAHVRAVSAESDADLAGIRAHTVAQLAVGLDPATIRATE